MDSSSYIALSRQTTLQDQLAVATNNLANANTPGYKGDQMVFHEFLERPQEGKQLAFVQNRGHAINFKQGGLNVTQNPLDFALQGKGFFAVQTPTGVRYTRDGHFIISPNGTLSTSDGYPVLSKDGAPINIPTDQSEVHVTKDGVVSVNLTGSKASDPTIVGTIAVVDFKDHGKMVKQGDNLYNANNQQPLDQNNTPIIQGALEKANVQSVRVLNKLVNINHTSQLVTGFISMEHDLQTTAIQTINKQ